MEFKELKIDQAVLEGLENMGIKTLTPIQEQSIPHILEGKNVIGASQTGTGKTAAYLVPLMDKIIRKKTENKNKDAIRGLILAPTRELANQIDAQIMGIGFHAGISSVPVIGGGNPKEWDQQVAGLRNKCDIIIATPGRLLMHINLEYVNFNDLEVLVVDEADRLLEMGFQEDLKAIVKQLPENRQTLLFSATMPPKVKKLTSWIMEDPVQVRTTPVQPAKGIKQIAYAVHDNDKIKLVGHLVNHEHIESLILFTGRKKNVNQIVAKLSKAGFTVEGIHSDRSQGEREEALRLFKNNQVKVLVATDILARGIDITGVSHVINYDVPRDAEDYIHRIGRTARAESTGVAITFVTPHDERQFTNIDRQVEAEIEKRLVPKDIGRFPQIKGFDQKKKKHSSPQQR